jgi:hypothetical protein
MVHLDMTTTPRLASQLWVNAMVRQGLTANIMVTVLAKGDAMAGSISLVRRQRDGQNSWYGATSDGTLLLMSTEKLSDSDVSVKVDRLRQSDPDAWVVEIECDDNTLFQQLLKPS